MEGLKRAASKIIRESLIAGLEDMGSQTLGGFQVNFSPTNHVPSSFVEMTMPPATGAFEPELANRLGWFSLAFSYFLKKQRVK